MEARFLLRRIGVLLFISGAAILAAAIGLQILEPKSETMETIPSSYCMVIDPGHGGADGGAVAADGTLEADVNLQIAFRLRSLATLCGVPVIMTRDSASIDYPVDAETLAAKKAADQKQRVELINSIQNAVLVSIHQNYYPAAGPHGAEALYAATDLSEDLGKLIQEMLIKTLDPENRRVAAPISEEIYLMRNVNCPAVLVECGFLSNPEELEKLKSDSYDQKLALVMLSAYLQYFQTGWNL